MTDENACPTCGTALPPGAAEGDCPRCLLAAGLASAPGEGRTASPAPEEIAPHFPALEIEAVLGQGGMGIVYRARQKHLDRPVALKVLAPETAREPGFAERFLREARTLARLSHPNIVLVHDFGESDGLYYLVMELVDGLNLREVLRAGDLAPAQALAIVPQVCEALQYAHDQGVVHRDIKPENILVTKDGRVKIADFGLAKLLSRAPIDVTLTRAGQVMGTLHYMAPEQYRAPDDVDHRADIYSLGVVFYEMLTGELPLGTFPPPSSHAGVDARLDAVVLRALERERENRWQHASELKSSVDTISAAPQPGTDPDSGADPGEARADATPPRPRLSRLAVAGALGVPVAAVVAVVAAIVEGHGDRTTAAVAAGAPLLVAAFALSVFAWRRIRRAPDRLRGAGWAVTGLALAPALALGVLFSGFFHRPPLGADSFSHPVKSEPDLDRARRVVGGPDLPVAARARIAESIETLWREKGPELVRKRRPMNLGGTFRVPGSAADFRLFAVVLDDDGAAARVVLTSDTAAIAVRAEKDGATWVLDPDFLEFRVSPATEDDRDGELFR